MTLTVFGDGSGFKLGIETIGSWARIADGERALFLRSQHTALKREGDRLKDVARQDVRASRIRGAARLATSWRGAIFPKDARAMASRPSYVLGNSAEIPLALLETGGTITAKGGALMIPIFEASKFKQPNFATREGRLSRTIAAMRAKYGKLSWHKLRNGTPALGAWVVTRAGRDRFRPLFILRKSVTIPKKLDTTARVAQAGQGFDQRVADETMRLFTAGHEAAVTRAIGGRGR